MDGVWFRSHDSIVYRISREPIPRLVGLHVNDAHLNVSVETLLNQPFEWSFKLMEPGQPEVSGQFVHAIHHVRPNEPVRFHYRSESLCPDEIREVDIVDRGPSYLVLFGFCHKPYFA